MHATLLKHLLETAPHVNHKVGSDWVGNTIKIIEQELNESGEILSEMQHNDLLEKKVKWHIKRLNGFGGSDMSVLYTEYKGGFSPHDMTAAKIVAGKLCLETPNGQNGDTERGTKLEPEARRKFELKMKKIFPSFRSYDAAYEAIHNFNEEGKGIEGHEWLKSSPDGVYIDCNNEIWLVDFKCPAAQTTVDDMTSEPPEYYKAQLAQYKYHLEKLGIKVHHTALVPFSTKKWDVEIAKFVVSEELTKDILAAGDKYWDFTMRNELPRLPMSENFQFAGEMPVVLQQVVADFALGKRFEANIKSMNDNKKRKLLKLSSLSGINWDQPDMKTRMPGVDITTKGVSKINYKKIAEDFRTMGGNPDDEKYKDVSEQTTVSLIRSKKSPHAPFINEMDDHGLRCIDYAYADMHEANGFNLTNDQIDQIIEDPAGPMYENTAGLITSDAVEAIDKLSEDKVAKEIKEPEVMTP